MNQIILYFNNIIILVFHSLKLLISKKIVNEKDIERSYNLVSSSYNNLFLEPMKSHTYRILNELYADNSSSIIDVGCGTGAGIKYFKEKYPNCSIIGIDKSDAMIAEAKKLIKSNKFTKNKLILGDALEVMKKLPSESFEVITFLWSMEYINFTRIVKEAYRLLKKGGLIAIITNRKDTLPEIRAIIWGMIFTNPKKLQKIMFNLPLFKNSSDLARALQKIKFKTVKSWDGKQTFKFNDSRDALKWIYSTGALAGYDKMFFVEDPIFLDYAEKKLPIIHNDAIRITHLFASVIATK